VKDLVAVVRAGLAARARPDKAPDVQAYLKSAMPLYGVPRAGHREIARGLPALEGFEAWRSFVLELWRGAERREERYVALDVIALPRYRAFRTMDALPLYEELIVTGAWWDLVDPIATRRLEELWPDVVPVLREWSVSEDLWLRRSAILAQVHRKAQTDFALLAELIEPNRGDREFFIRKAIGWALREFAKTDPEAVAAYCDAHELSGLSRREALKHRGAARAPRAGRASGSGRSTASGA
jgi:3-methyladenine DNA glycosylase AlkD